MRRSDIVFHTPLFDDILLGMINAVGGTPVSIARLANAADVDEIFFPVLDRDLIHFHTINTIRSNEGDRDVRVSEKAKRGMLISEARDRVEVVQHVTPLARSIERRVHDGKIANLPREPEAEEPGPVGLGEICASPINGSFCQLIEVAGGGLERGMFVVISSHDWTFERAHALDAFMWIRVVADNIAETNEMGALALPGIGYGSFERFEIGVNVAENREAHDNELAFVFRESAHPAGC